MLTKEEILKSAYDKIVSQSEDDNWEDFDPKNSSAEIGYIAMNEFARHIAIDFFNWQKKDYVECCADMSVEEWFDKYTKYTK